MTASHFRAPFGCRFRLISDRGPCSRADRLQGRYSDVNIEMTLADRRVSLIEEGYDLVVRMGAVADSELMFRKIADLPRALVASPAFLAAHSNLSTPQDVEMLPALAIRRDLIEWDLKNADGTGATVRPGSALPQTARPFSSTLPALVWASPICRNS